MAGWGAVAPVLTLAHCEGKMLRWVVGPLCSVISAAPAWYGWDTVSNLAGVWALPDVVLASCAKSRFNSVKVEPQLLPFLALLAGKVGRGAMLTPGMKGCFLIAYGTSRVR